MRYGEVEPALAENCLLAHSLQSGALRLAKGKRLSREDVSALRAAGCGPIMVAILEPGDVHEDEAALRAAGPLVGAHLEARPAHGGRVNLHATTRGVLCFDAGDVDALNLIDEALTLATAPAHALIEQGEIVATIKVIPYAASERALMAWSRAKPMRIAPLAPLKVGLIQTRAGALKESVLDKTARITAARVEALGGALAGEARVAHKTAELANAIQQRLAAGDDLVLICGASAVADRQDVGPAAIVACGGVVEHFGMPVDPGNLMLIGRVGAKPALVMPGCARSPQPNGFDAILRMVFAREPVSREKIARMGVGGLLHDALWRPAPRLLQAPAAMDAGPKIAAVILAAGRSSRMGAHKLTLDLLGKPLLSHVVDKVKRAGFCSVTLVLGHRAAETRALFEDQQIDFVVNERFAEGLSTSLQCGVGALPQDVDGAMIFLGDMPDVEVDLIGKMIAAFDPANMRSIVTPMRAGRRGHPVLWGKAFFPALIEKTSGIPARGICSANSPTGSWKSRPATTAC